MRLFRSGRRLVVVSRRPSIEARLECGELMRAVDRGIASWSTVSTLGEVIAGTAHGAILARRMSRSSGGRASPSPIIAIAGHLYKAAIEQGRGRPLGWRGLRGCHAVDAARHPERVRLGEFGWQERIREP